MLLPVDDLQGAVLKDRQMEGAVVIICLSEQLNHPTATRFDPHITPVKKSRS